MNRSKALKAAKVVLEGAKADFRRAKQGESLADRILESRNQDHVDAPGQQIDAANFLLHNEAPLLNGFYEDHHQSETRLGRAVKEHGRRKWAYEHPVLDFSIRHARAAGSGVVAGFGLLGMSCSGYQIQTGDMIITADKSEYVRGSDDWKMRGSYGSPAILSDEEVRAMLDSEQASLKERELDDVRRDLNRSLKRRYKQWSTHENQKSQKSQSQTDAHLQELKKLDAEVLRLQTELQQLDSHNKSRSVYKRNKGSTIWQPADVFEGEHVTATLGGSLDESGNDASLDVEMLFADIELALNVRHSGIERLFGDIELEDDTNFATLSLANGTMRGRVNVVQGTENLLDEFTSIAFPSATLTQTTNRMDETETTTSLYSGYLSIDASPDLVVYASANDLRRIEEFLGNQTDRIVGQSFVPGFGWVDVDSTAATNTRVKTKESISGFTTGFESEIAPLVYAGARATLVDHDIETILNGTPVFDQNLDNWRFLATLQYNKFFAQTGYLWQLNDDLDSQVVGGAGAVFALGDYSIVSPTFIRDDNGRFAMSTVFSLRRPNAAINFGNVLTDDDAQRMMDYQRSITDNQNDMTLTERQRQFADWELFERYVRRSDSITAGLRIRRFGDNNRYSLMAGIPLVQGDGVLVLGSFTAGRDYESFRLGGSFRIRGANVSVAGENVRDDQQDSRERLYTLGVTFGGN